MRHFASLRQHFPHITCSGNFPSPSGLSIAGVHKTRVDFILKIHKYSLSVDFCFAEERFPLLSDHSFIPEFHQELIQQGTWENQGMCACVRFAWALVLRSCSQWPNIVGAVEVLEEDEGMLELAVDESVFGFFRYCVLGAANFHQEVC